MTIKLISHLSDSSPTRIRFSQAHTLTELDHWALTQARNQKVGNRVSLIDDKYSGHLQISNFGSKIAALTFLGGPVLRYRRPL